LIWVVATGLIASVFGQGGLPVWGGATVRWSTNRELDVVAYRVYYGSFPGQYLAALPVGKTNAARIEGLLPGSTNYFMVTAVNRKGVESYPSKEVPCLIKPPAFGPGGTTTTSMWQPYPVIRLASERPIERNLGGLSFSLVEFDQGAVTVRWQGAPGVLLERATRLDALDWTAIPGTEGRDVHRESVWEAAAFYRLARPRAVAVE
jgi:hypothetical protein